MYITTDSLCHCQYRLILAFRTVNTKESKMPTSFMYWDRKKKTGLEYQLALWTSNSQILLAQGSYMYSVLVQVNLTMFTFKSYFFWPAWPCCQGWREGERGCSLEILKQTLKGTRLVGVAQINFHP